jgi:hypothetical protein
LRSGRRIASWTGLTLARSSSMTTSSLNDVLHFEQVTRTIQADSSLPSTRMSDRAWFWPHTLQS